MATKDELIKMIALQKAQIGMILDDLETLHSRLKIMTTEPYPWYKCTHCETNFLSSARFAIHERNCYMKEKGT